MDRGLGQPGPQRCGERLGEALTAVGHGALKALGAGIGVEHAKAHGPGGLDSGHRFLERVRGEDESAHQ